MHLKTQEPGCGAIRLELRLKVDGRRTIRIASIARVAFIPPAQRRGGDTKDSTSDSRSDGAARSEFDRAPPLETFWLPPDCSQVKRTGTTTDFSSSSK
jgi:hypothetical protein